VNSIQIRNMLLTGSGSDSFFIGFSRG